MSNMDMALKQAFHPLADEKNYIAERRGKAALLCGGRRKNTAAFCRSYAGAGTAHKGYGRCRRCAGASTGPRTEEGKATAAQNSRKHGIYSRVLSPAAREVYESQTDGEAISLLHDIKMHRANIVVYLADWRRKWDNYYQRKLREKYVKYRCMNPDCRHVCVKGELDGKPGYCPASRCHEKRVEVIERWTANRTESEAEAYADAQTRVWYSEGEGARSYYHAGSLEDRTLDRALNTLGRLIEKHARLKPDDSDDLLGQINSELRAASKGKIVVSWGGAAQHRVNPAETLDKGAK
nr:hypothetical protein [Paenibacillus roseus]